MACCFLGFLAGKLWVHTQEQATAGRSDVAWSWVMIGDAAALPVGMLAATTPAAAVSAGSVMAPR